MFLAIDHVQLAIPSGGEDMARWFWCDLLGFVELPKPEALAKRGGAWFQLGNVQVHVGIEAGFVPTQKAHPAFLVSDLTVLVDGLIDAGFHTRWDYEIPEVIRCHINDPFGNRIELIEQTSGLP
jgi:catechol 2,3-dioxygenase-like lactoylglutathione lyase family enzyme